MLMKSALGLLSGVGRDSRWDGEKTVVLASRKSLATQFSGPSPLEVT